MELCDFAYAKMHRQCCNLKTGSPFMDGFFPRELATGGSSLLKGAWLTGYDVVRAKSAPCLLCVEKWFRNYST